MVTDKERREAARELRGYGFDVLKDGSLLSTLKDVTGRSCWRDCLIALADLIEPQERTCEVVRHDHPIVWQEGCMMEHVSCSACHFWWFWDECDTPPRYCPHCGARIEWVGA